MAIKFKTNFQKRGKANLISLYTTLKEFEILYAMSVQLGEKDRLILKQNLYQLLEKLN